MSVARQVFHQIYVARAEAMGWSVAEPDLLKTKTTTNGSKATANYGASNVGHIAQDVREDFAADFEAARPCASSRSKTTVARRWALR